ncbi:MAG: Gfo/Idh/MocA family oxidoreductase [Planctomycetes bacterium]|nr:Gfo/Idh/MocA family oxidoreductase [Planctomycetota bacterium]
MGDVSRTHRARASWRAALPRRRGKGDGRIPRARGLDARATPLLTDVLSEGGCVETNANHSGAKVAVIGAGYWGKNLVRNYHGLGALAMVCDREASVRAAFEKTYPGLRTAPSLSEALADPGIGAVAIATPAELHARLAREALLAGKDVFVEKPLALDVEDAREVVRIAEEKGRILMVGHVLHYHPAVRALFDLVRKGGIGRVQYVYSSRLNLGKIRREENILWSFAPHDISLILGLTQEMPERVTCVGGNYLHRGISDITVSCFLFPSGIRSHVFVSWLHPFKEQKMIVVGTEGMLVFDDTAKEDKLLHYPHEIHWKDSVPVPEKKDARRVAFPAAEPLAEECRHFLECVSARSEPLTSGQEGLRVLRVLRACQESLEREGDPRAPAAAADAAEYFVHPTAVIDPGAKIGRGTKVWHYSHILSGVEIGERCVIGQNVMIGPRVKVGNNCKIQNNVSLYEGVSLEDDVFCGPSCVFTNVRNPRSHVSRKDQFLPTRIGRGATIGANATVVCGTSIGAYAFIGAGAVVTRPVPEYGVAFGNPARLKGWRCNCGEKVEMGEAGGRCEVCGRTYRLEAPGRLVEIRDGTAAEADENGSVNAASSKEARSMKKAKSMKEGL